MLGVSRQVRQEASATFYEGNRFCLMFSRNEDFANLERWLERLGPVNVRCLRHLIFMRRDCTCKLDLYLPVGGIGTLEGDVGGAKMAFMAMVPHMAGMQAKLLADLESLLPVGGRRFDVAGLRAFFKVLHFRTWERKEGKGIPVVKIEGVVKDDEEDDD